MGRLRFACFLTFAACASPAVAADKEICAQSRSAIDAAATRTLKQGSPGILVQAAERGRPLFVRAYGQADAWMTRSVESTMTADDDRTDSTVSAPGGISATGSGSSLLRRSL